jgi:hypothetical protein
VWLEQVSFKKRYSCGFLANPDDGERPFKTFFKEIKILSKKLTFYGWMN